MGLCESNSQERLRGRRQQAILELLESTKKGQPLKERNQLFSDALSKAKTLGDQFSSVFTDDTPDIANIRNEGPRFPPIKDLIFTTEGVKKLLNGLNPGKTGGPDGMSPP